MMRSHLAAIAEGGRRHGLCWAGAGPLRKTRGDAGLLANGLNQRRAKNKEEKVEGNRKLLPYFKRDQTTEFKHRFEINQTKIVHQHECNNKLL
jgi:hypothetical protein